MMVTNFLPGLVDLQDSVCDAWSQPQDPAKPTYQYVRGTIFFDMMKTGSALWPLARELEKSDHPNFPMDEDTVGKLYDEDQTPDYLVPRVFGTNEISLFFLQQIGMTYKSLTWMAMKQTGFDTNSLQAWFIAPFVTFFEKCEVTVEFIFFCVCWTRSVAALQGNGVLSRNISMAILHLYKLEDRLEEAMRGVTDQTLHVDLKVLQTVIRKTEVFNPGLRANPILTGCHLLEYHLKYISIMPQISPVALQLRAICHLYSALRDRKLLNEIPFFEDAIRVYEHVFFKPGRQQAIRGSYTKVYLMSTGMAESTVNDLLIGQGLTREQFLSRTRPDFQLPELSNVSRFLSQDFSSLPSELVKSGNWVAHLDAVADCCTCELFDTRVLSRDFVKLSKDLADTFDCLWSILDWDDHGKFRVGNPPDKPIELKQVGEIVDKVMLPLLPLLDGMNSDGSLEFSVECINVFRRRGALQNTLAHALGSSGDNCETLLGFCRDMASQFVLRFGDSTALEKDYYTFPSTPDWITREFSGAKLCSERNPEQTAETFETLMKMMKSFDGPLQGDKLEEFKRLIKEDPDVLDLATPGSDIELCTLLHQAAAGRARDKRLVEWLIHMGALDRQPRHFQNPPKHGESRTDEDHDKELCNYLAVHSAAKAGSSDIVKLLLEAGRFRDLNKVTYHTKQSLAHIAAKNDDRWLLATLLQMGALFTSKDSTGKYVHDYFSDTAVKREFLDLVVKQRKREKEKSPGTTSVHRPVKTEIDATDLAGLKEFEDMLKRQREAGQFNDPAPSPGGRLNPSRSTMASAKTSKKKKKNKKKKEIGSGEEEGTVAVDDSWMNSTSKMKAQR